MRTFLITAIFLFLHMPAICQKTRQDLTKSVARNDRKEILAALKLALQPGLRLKPSLVVKNLILKDNFAIFQGAAKNTCGKEIDFRKTVYKELVDQGMFDGDATTALLKKKTGKWKVLQFSVGPTDVPWGCWWKEFSAPKEIFSYVENACVMPRK